MYHTEKEIKELKLKALNRLISFAGSQPHLAKMLETPIPVVNGWVKRGQISKLYAVKASLHNNISQHFTAEELRPDITEEEIIKYTLQEMEKDL